MADMKRYISVWAVAVLLLTVGCSREEDSLSDAGIAPGQELTGLSFDVSEEPWNEERVRLTRGATLDDLRAATEHAGFGLYLTSGLINLENKQFTWDSENLRWHYGTWNSGESKWNYETQQLLWPKAAPTVLYAYAPYMSLPSANTSYSDGVLTFTPTLANTTDLLWGEKAPVTDGTVRLTFRHALAKISFGTLTNRSGQTVTLTDITLTGQFYKSGNLSLENGTWSDEAKYDPVSQTIDRSPASSLEVDNDATESIGVSEVLQIPGPEITVTFTFDIGNVTHTASATTTLTQGKHTTYYLTIQNNFEVIITQ